MLLSMELCCLPCMMSLGSEQLCFEILAMDFSCLKISWGGINLWWHGGANIRVRWWGQTLSDEWVLQISVEAINLLFLLLASHGKIVDPNTSCNPICCQDVGCFVLYFEVEVLERVKATLQISNCMFRLYLHPWDMVVEDLIVRQVLFWFLVGGDNPCINLVRMSQKAGAWDQKQPLTYRVCRISPDPFTILHQITVLFHQSCVSPGCHIMGTSSMMKGKVDDLKIG